MYEILQFRVYRANIEIDTAHLKLRKLLRNTETSGNSYIFWYIFKVLILLDLTPHSFQ